MNTSITNRILIVDDDFVSRTKMQAILEQFGECTAVDSGEAALKLFETSLMEGHPFNLLSLDIEMPDMDGIEVLTRIRAIEAERKSDVQQWAKVLMVTAVADKNNLLKSLKSGCDDFVVKPFEPQTIIAKLKKMTFC